MNCKNCNAPLIETASFCGSCGTPVAEVILPASSLRRFANAFLDEFIYIIIAIALLILFSGKVPTWVMYMIFVFYYVGFEYLFQRTPAKFITKTKVVDQNGEKPSFGRILGRNIARLIPFDAFSYLFTPVGWHDSLSKTYVVPASYTAEQVRQIRPEFYKHSTKGKIFLSIIIILISLAVIGVVFSVMILSLNSARAKSRDEKRVTDIASIQEGLNKYFTTNKQYPESLERLAPQYLESLPTAPVPPDGSCTLKDSEYYYVRLSANNYKLSFCLGEARKGYKQGINVISR